MRMVVLAGTDEHGRNLSALMRSVNVGVWREHLQLTS